MLEGASTGAVAGTAISPGLGTAIGAGIGALGSIAGSYLSGKSAKKAAKKANQLAIWQQQQAQQWQEYMSNTAHQREVEDLKAAGLNPVLSANSGASAGSVGIGNTPAYESYDYSNTAKDSMEAIGKALAIKGMQNQTKNTEADVGLKEAQTEEANTRKNIVELEKDILEIEKPKIIATARAEQAQAKLQEEIAKNPLYQAGTKFRSIANEFLSPIGTIFGMATSGAKTAIANKVANNYGRYETLTENYDGDHNPLSFKVHHYNK